eukprot:3130449-Prymnesium_polylepis.1
MLRAAGGHRTLPVTTHPPSCSPRALPPSCHHAHPHTWRVHAVVPSCRRPPLCLLAIGKGAL